MNILLNMSNEEIKEQLEWSVHHEFSYNYAIWAFEEIDRLNNKLSELEDINEKIGLALDSAENKVDRLNNILNELEKYLIEHIDEYREMEQDAMFEFGLVLDKLKALKEENK